MIKIRTINRCLFYINDNKLLENYKTIWTKIEDLKKLNRMISQTMTIDI